jgi:hypothetical protein
MNMIMNQSAITGDLGVLAKSSAIFDDPETLEDEDDDEEPEEEDGEEDDGSLGVREAV